MVTHLMVNAAASSTSLPSAIYRRFTASRICYNRVPELTVCWFISVKELIVCWDSLVRRFGAEVEREKFYIVLNAICYVFGLLAWNGCTMPMSWLICWRETVLDWPSIYGLLSIFCLSLLKVNLVGLCLPAGGLVRELFNVFFEEVWIAIKPTGSSLMSWF